MNTLHNVNRIYEIEFSYFLWKRNILLICKANKKFFWTLGYRSHFPIAKLLGNLISPTERKRKSGWR